MKHSIKMEFDGGEYYFDYEFTADLKPIRHFLETQKINGWINWFEILDGEETFYLREHLVDGICHNENGPAFYTMYEQPPEYWITHYSLHDLDFTPDEWLKEIKLREYNKSFENVIND